MATPASIARDQAGLTIDQAAKKLRISKRTLQVYESGRGKNLYRARKIARLYKCSLFGCFTQQGISQQIAVK